MNKFLLLFILLVPFLAGAQQRAHVVRLTRDSIQYQYTLNEDWRFHIGDSAAMAAPGYDDSKWEVVNPALTMRDNPKKESEKFNGVCWLRLHIVVDSTLTGEPLALKMAHFGASEVYLDGKLVMSFGTISDSAHCYYVDPLSIPFAINIPTAGEHVLAVKYANYRARYNYKVCKRDRAGFTMGIGNANELIRFSHRSAVISSFIVVILFGIFLALSLLHLFLYLFHRSVKSNLYCSLFCLSLAMLFFLGFLNTFSSNPVTQLNLGLYYIIVTSFACFSFSAFNNELFGKKKLRFRIVIALCVLAPVIAFFNTNVSGVIYIILVAFVSVEGVVATLVGIYRKVRGAGIIGFGILFFALFFLVIITLAVTQKNFDVNDSNTAGKVFEFFASAAILSIPLSMSAYLAWSFSAVNKDLKNQLQQVKLLSDRALEQELEKQQLLENRKEELEKEVAQRTEEVTSQKQEIEKQHAELKVEKKKSDDLLLNILPEEVAEELKQKGTSEAKFFDHVTVLFTDFVDFTKAGERMAPQELVDELHTCFKAFDGIISKYNIEKIKTIGDAYLAVCGLPLAQKDHAANCARAAIEIRQYMEARRQLRGDKTFEIRIGLHSGSVVAGIVGVKKFAYDIWGDTVNTAARMEQNSERGRINISQVTHDLIKDQFVCTSRGEIAAKNKGALSMYFVEGEK